jgi:hypothetical protein
VDQAHGRRGVTRCEVFPAGRRKQHASRVLHPEASAARGTQCSECSEPSSRLFEAPPFVLCCCSLFTFSRETLAPAAPRG